MTVVDLNIARVEREQDNKKVSVEELLRLALKDVITGDVKNAKRAVLILVSEGEGEDPAWVFEGYRCGLNRMEEVAVLDLFKVMQIKKWMEAQ